MINKSWFQKGNSPPEHKEGCQCCRCTKISPMKGIERTKEQKEHHSNIMKGKKAWNKGLTKETDERVKRSGLNVSKSLKGIKQTPEHIRNSLHRRPMSSLEIKFNDIIHELKLPYKFVGNGKLFIERKNPDFINEDKKIAIEVFYTKHKCIVSTKDKFNVGYDASKLDRYINERKEIFNRNGWKVLFFNECQVNRDFIINQLNLVGGN